MSLVESNKFHFTSENDWIFTNLNSQAKPNTIHTLKLLEFKFDYIQDGLKIKYIQNRLAYLIIFKSQDERILIEPRIEPNNQNLLVSL